ncbi:MAG TPA: AMP-binding protein [Bryobacteraceae bacterium]|nr:AMP-binding protein [Bryobacteraceae bacterium]
MLIEGLIANGAAADLALLAHERPPMTYSGLRLQVDRTRAVLQRLGFRQEDRIAVVLPNGPELAAAFLSISAASGVAPLNPNYSVDEFRFYLGDLGAAALATVPGFCPAAEKAAQSLGIRLLGLRASSTAPAGTFSVEADQQARVTNQPRAEERGRLALLLHSSGTTARPKLVGLKHENLCASAGSVAATLRLTPDDRTLNIMPLFHIHGLVGVLLSSLSAGASVYCSPGFNALQFGRWMRDAQPSWYSAVPSMHQALLLRAGEIERYMARPLRLIRSSSAHLDTQVWKRLETQFGCPALNAYGMTEAAHQIASNPLPPGERTYGSAGLPAGSEVAIVDERCQFQPHSTTGEIAIRGVNVIGRYLHPVEANSTSFVDGWLRTGDQGVMDANGYVFITGRLKELINIGGEKVSPAEIDAVLMQHPAVTQAVTFGAACASRGERICAAVVVDSDTSEPELKRFVRERLASFKTPSTVLMVAEIPKGPTGKIQRIGMAKRLGLE